MTTTITSASLAETAGQRGPTQDPGRLLAKLVPVLFEDERLLAVLKPAGIDTGDARADSVPGLAEILAAVRGGNVRLHASNRLSRYESGILLFGKERWVADAVRKALKAGRVRSEYLAVTAGRANSSRRIVSGAADRKAAKHARNTSNTNRKRSGERKSPTGGTGASTVVDFLRRGPHRSVIRCRTTAENTHSLRAQLRSMQIRVLGDAIGDRSPRAMPAAQTCLHLSRLQLTHPNGTSSLELKAPAPQGLAVDVESFFFVERALHAGLVRRAECLGEPQTDCFRLLTGDFEDVSGVVVDRWGAVVMLQVQSERLPGRELLERMGAWYRRVLRVASILSKGPSRHRSAPESEVDDWPGDVEVLSGGPAAEPLIVCERGLHYRIRFDQGASVGLFPDQRENRDRVRAAAAGKDVLNLFAYTCAFSVAAAAGGARRTVSVDVSLGHLKWGRENFRLNGLDPDPHGFIRSGALEYLKRARRLGEQFDIIVLDPPTFAHGRRGKNRFSLQEDLIDLIHDAVTLLRPRGVLFLSTNFRRMTRSGLRDRLSQGSNGRPFEIMEFPSLPADFAVDPNHAKSLFARFE
jgi:23S rRNA (cytosine1962-C5)-methyltransferase